MVLRIILTIVVGYFLGGANGAILVSRFLFRDDVRNHGSGNAGMTNFIRAYGGPATLLVIAIDLGKIFLACWIGGLLMNATGWKVEGQMLGGVAGVLGHMYPVLFRFQGGKGILSTLALAIFMDWRIAVTLFSLFLIIVLVTKYMSLGSSIAAFFYPVAFAICFWGHWAVIALSFVGWLDVWRHRANIRRLLNGTEPKFSFKH